MDQSRTSQGGLDYYPCRYGRSRLLFRGPRKRLEGQYIAVIGGSETYGKYVPQPFPELLEQFLDLPVVNFGCLHAGVSVFTEDHTVLEACAAAEITVIQIMGAQNMSNRLYTVHPRRNDRFLKASGELRSIYGEVDFTEFHFTRHLLKTLHEISPEQFARVEAELKESWVRRMRLLIERIGGPVVLLWMSERSPDDPGGIVHGIAPHFVDRPMLEALRPDVTGIVEVVASDRARAEGLENMVVPDLEAAAAAGVPGPVFHTETAVTLAEHVPEYLDELRHADGYIDAPLRAAAGRLRVSR